MPGLSANSQGMVGRCEEWPISGVMDARGWTELYSGKRGMVRAGGSASGSSEIVVRLTPAAAGGGASTDLTGPQMSRPFRPWGATLLRMMDGVNVRFRMTVGTCRKVKQQSCRSLLWRWAEVLLFHKGTRWVNLRGGCDLQGRVGRRRRNL